MRQSYRPTPTYSASGLNFLHLAWIMPAKPPSVTSSGRSRTSRKLATFPLAPPLPFLSESSFRSGRKLRKSDDDVDCICSRGKIFTVSRRNTMATDRPSYRAVGSNSSSLGYQREIIKRRDIIAAINDGGKRNTGVIYLGVRSQISIRFQVVGETEKRKGRSKANGKVCCSQQWTKDTNTGAQLCHATEDAG